MRLTTNSFNTARALVPHAGEDINAHGFPKSHATLSLSQRERAGVRENAAHHLARWTSLVLIALTSFSLTASAAPKLKLGTLAPVGTSYHKSLMTMAETWRK